MGKEELLDLIPATVPAKRRVLEDSGKTPDVWLAVWANDESLPPSQRSRAAAERERRRGLPGRQRAVGLILPAEGLTPQQHIALWDYITTSGVTTLHRPTVLSSTNHHRTRALQVPLVMHEYEQEIVKASDLVVACPKESYEPVQKPSGVWYWIKYTKHRNTPIVIVRPNGEVT